MEWIKCYVEMKDLEGEHIVGEYKRVSYPVKTQTNNVFLEWKVEKILMCDLNLGSIRVHTSI